MIGEANRDMDIDRFEWRTIIHNANPISWD